MKTRLLLLLLLIPILTRAQIITTVAGTGVRGYSGDGGQATNAQLSQPFGLSFDGAGNMYIADDGNDNIRKVTPKGIITTIAGSRHEDGSFTIPENITPGFIKDGGEATAALVWKPHHIAADHSGNLYFPEYANGTIRKISAYGIVTTIAGRPPQFTNNTGSNLAVNTKLHSPNGIAIDKDDNIYFADEHDNVVRKISTDGTITTVAGNGYRGYSGDEDAATAVRLNEPWGVTIDAAGNLYIADRGNERIRKVNAAGIITTIAGTGDKGSSGDGGPAIDAQLDGPAGIALDTAGNLYIADSRNDAVRVVNTRGIISTFAGNGNKQYHGDDGFISSVAYSQRKGNCGDGGPATAAQLYWPYDVAVDAVGNVYIADDQNHVIRKVSAPPPKKESLKEEPPKAEPVKEIPKKEEPPKAEAPKPEPAFKVSVDAERNVLTIIAAPDTYTSFTITDGTGKTLIQQPIKSLQTDVDISTLPPAHYHVNLQKGSEVKSVMFVKDN